MANPSVFFVLTHFSRRYSDEEITAAVFGDTLATEATGAASCGFGVPGNVGLWLDSGVVTQRAP